MIKKMLHKNAKEPKDRAVKQHEESGMQNERKAIIFVENRQYMINLPIEERKKVSLQIDIQ